MLKKIAVIGAGTMGAGIAQWFCQQDIEVELLDIHQEILDSSKAKIYESWDKLEKKNKFSSDEIKKFKSSINVKPLYLNDSKELALSHDTDLVLEAIIEDLELKRKLFRSLDSHCSKHTIIASNTSSLPIASLAQSISNERKKVFLGLHFFNPATIMKLVEIIPLQETDKKTVSSLSEWLRERNKKPANCADSPGFIVNRVARNFYGESLRVLSEAGHSQKNARQIDHVLKECGGFKMGPFELMDLIGIDVNYNVTQSVWESFYRESRFAPHLIQKQMVDAGKLGKKTKKGFYDYE